MQGSAKKLLLQSFGWDESEAATYLSCLQNGPQTVLKIANATGIPRSSLYLTINRLVSEGALREVYIRMKKMYVAEKPQILQQVAQAKYQLLSEKLVPSLELLCQSNNSNVDISTFRDRLGIRTLYSDILNFLKPGDEYLCISDTEKWLRDDTDFFQAYLKKRIRLRTKDRLILQGGKIAEKYKGFRKDMSVRSLPHSIEVRTCQIILPPTKVIFHTFGPHPQAVMLQNENITAMQETLFETLWCSLSLKEQN
jgi:sugar-specific transcriptional regulator TrmB